MGEGNGVQISLIHFKYGNTEVQMKDVDVVNRGGRSAYTAPAVNVIDGKTTTKWSDSEMKPLELTFPKAIKVDEFSFGTANDLPKRDPVQWCLKGSTDGYKWVVLHLQDVDFETPLRRRESSGWLKLRKFGDTQLKAETS